MKILPRARAATGRVRYRTVFLSDLHLGFAAARVAELGRFLDAIQPRKLYLVGDVVDLEALARCWRWPPEHDAIVRRILTMARTGTEVVYLPGNHDQALRGYVGIAVGGVRVKARDVHTTADGRRLLVLHGDRHQEQAPTPAWLLSLGTRAYDALVAVDRGWTAGRRRLGLAPRPFAQAVKRRLGSAAAFVRGFGDALATEARRRKLDGVVCGHVHEAEARSVPGGRDVEYFNCGDWVESCTALVEHDDGTMEIVDGRRPPVALDRPATVAAPGRLLAVG